MLLQLPICLRQTDHRLQILQPRVAKSGGGGATRTVTIVVMDRAFTNRDEVRRVLIAGDTHGNTKWVQHLARVAARSDCPVIIQVGDFGYFPDHRDGPRFISDVDRACAATNVELRFIDGNHDDHTSLAELEHGHVPVHVAEHVTYLPRGTRLQLSERTFGFLGGAFSVDWRDRTAGIDWWHHEVTDTDDVARLGTERLDVLIAHDAPAGIELLSSWKLPAEDQVRADDSCAGRSGNGGYLAPTAGPWSLALRLRVGAQLDRPRSHGTVGWIDMGLDARSRARMRR